MSELPIGILGLGFLGDCLAELQQWHQNSWGTKQSNEIGYNSNRRSIHTIRFNWEENSSWTNLPECQANLVLTIPPVKSSVKEEAERLYEWCEWSVKNRPGFKKLVYISSTGVYPNQAGLWKETDRFNSDSDKGQLRLTTEKILSDFFEVRVVRSGAIYGKGRNIGERIRQGKPIPRGLQPIHRIHVSDLAEITAKALSDEDFPPIVNVIDLLAETTSDVAKWLLKQPFFQKLEPPKIAQETGYHTRKFSLSEPDRRIDNSLLADKLKHHFHFSTYKEGLKACFA